MGFQTLTAVEEKSVIAPAWWQLTFSLPDFSSPFLPGQFFLVRTAATPLRRPIFPQYHTDGRFSVLLRPTTDPGLSWLVARQPNDQLDLLGPLGHGYRPPEGIANLLLISDTQWLSPLLFQMNLAVAAGCAVTVAHGAARASALYPVDHLPPAVEFYTATQDGSQGQRGTIAQVSPPLLRWADAVLAVGSTTLYQTLKRHTWQERLIVAPGFLHGLVGTDWLPCGVGACFGCPVSSSGGPKLSCIDGPVFDLAELDLE